MNFKAFLFQTTYHRRRPLLELLFRSIFCHIVHFLLEERCGLRFSRFRKFDWGLLGLIVKKFFIDPLKTDLIAWQMITHIFLYRLWISFLKHLVDLISHFTLNLFIINFTISISIINIIASFPHSFIQLDPYLLTEVSHMLANHILFIAHTP